MASVFKDEEFYLPAADQTYSLLPFRFIHLDSDRYVAVNEVGESQVLPRNELELLVRKRLTRSSPLYYALKASHFLEDSDSDIAADLLTLKVRSKRERIARFTSLHMFVVTLRCNHSCQYCQVSRQSEDRSAYDMTEAMADRALDFTFRSPSPAIKIEFQGGEPLLNFDLIKYIVSEAESRNAAEKRQRSSTRSPGSPHRSPTRA